MLEFYVEIIWCWKRLIADFYAYILCVYSQCLLLLRNSAWNYRNCRDEKIRSLFNNRALCRRKLSGHDFLNSLHTPSREKKHRELLSIIYTATLCHIYFTFLLYILYFVVYFPPFCVQLCPSLWFFYFLFFNITLF